MLDTLIVFLKEFLKEFINYEKKSADNEIHENLPSIQSVNVEQQYRPLVKHAYQIFFFVFINQNVCCGYAKEPSQ